MEIDDDQIEELSLTPKQLEAAKAVYKAMKSASRLGVHFWDNYGTLTAYNARKISVPHMVDRGNDYLEFNNSEKYFDASRGEGSLVLYNESLSNFHAGNSDDQFFAEIL